MEEGGRLIHQVLMKLSDFTQLIRDNHAELNLVEHLLGRELGMMIDLPRIGTPIDQRQANTLARGQHQVKEANDHLQARAGLRHLMFLLEETVDQAHQVEDDLARPRNQVDAVMTIRDVGILIQYTRMQSNIPTMRL